MDEMLFLKFFKEFKEVDGAYISSLILGSFVVAGFIVRVTGTQWFSLFPLKKGKRKKEKKGNG